MVSRVSRAERRLKHAVNQNKYHQKKRETHKKICIWVPKDAVENFLKSVERMKRKWLK